MDTALYKMILLLLLLLILLLLLLFITTQILVGRVTSRNQGLCYND